MLRRSSFVLFVPLYGGGGTGELFRCLAIAQALHRRHPSVRIEFLLPGGPGTSHDVPFPALRYDGPPSEKGEFDRQVLARLRPDIAIFDSGLRTSTLILCRRLGIRTVYISDRAGTRRKPFRLTWAGLLDMHWHQLEHLNRPAFTPWQRAVAAFSRTRRLVFDTYYPEEAPDLSILPRQVQERLQAPFVLFVPGGGGYQLHGVPVAEIFWEAADRLHAACGVGVLTLLGPFYAPRSEARWKTCSMRQVSQVVLLELMRRADVVVTNGGQALIQALAAGAATVAAPLGGDDQPGRIGSCVEAGLAIATAPNASALADAAEGLVRNRSLREALRRRVAARPVPNGIPLMLDALDKELLALQAVT
jgi:hypothetical protein